MGCFWAKYIMFELKECREIMSDGTKDWCKIWRKFDLCFQNWHEEFGKFSQAGKSDFILESKLAELNKNKNSKQSDLPDAAWKLCFTLEINE